MSKTINANETTAADAARMSADTGEIVRVRCNSIAHRSEFAAAVSAAIDNDDCFGGDDAESEMEVVGDIDGEDVRVHLIVANA